MEAESDKSILRAQMKLLLRSIPIEQRRQASDRAASLLRETPEYQQCRSILIFVSLPSEIDTHPIAVDAWSAGRTVAVPRVDMKDRSMRAVVIRNFNSDMARTPIGVMEPVGGEEIDSRDIDLILVPGLGFGLAGERIGRGAGFYDRFLANPLLRATACGYAFEQQFAGNIPMSPTDTYLHMLVTDQAVRRFVTR